MKTTINLSSLSPPEPFGKKKVQCNGFLGKVILSVVTPPQLPLASTDSVPCLLYGFIRKKRHNPE
jgi:hypothetical protein